MPRTSNSHLLRGGPGSCQCHDDETRKIVTAQILTGRALTSFPVGAAAPGEQRVRLQELHSNAPGLARSGQTLFERFDLWSHLKEVVSRLCGLHGFDALPTDDLSRKAAEALREEVEQLASRCAARQANSEIVYVVDLFEFVLRTTEKAYEDYVPGGLGTGVVVNLALRGLPSAVSLAAATQFGPKDRRDAREADVSLDFSRQSFCGADVGRLLLMLFHEIFVHAVQSIECAGARSVFGDDCPLSEGFVDRGSFRVLVASLTRQHLPEQWQEMGVKLCHGVEAVHAERTDESRAPSSLGEAHARFQRAYGKEIFDKLAEIRGLDWALALAVRLNLSDLDKKERRGLMDAVYRSFGTRKNTVAVLGKLDRIVSGENPRIIL
ncbi:hypothetical protein LCM4579_27325 [Ensifer sp. LCM 4579]|nr:hypothetical protein LCM4579_27325 [Ensifer sp. LCM 4579]